MNAAQRTDILPGVSPVAIVKRIGVPAIGGHFAGGAAAFVDQSPERLQIGRARKPASHADDRDRLGRRLACWFLSRCSSNFRCAGDKPATRAARSLMYWNVASEK